MFLKKGFLEPLLAANLALRLVLLFVALYLGHWVAGDSGYFIASAAKVCGGEWGGDASRSPFYMWFLCGLSPGIQPSSTASAFFLPLLTQHLLVWIAGVWFFHKFGKGVAVLWLYDPVVLIYSNLVMSDIVFSLSVLLLAWQVREMFKIAATQDVAKKAKAGVFPQAFYLGLALALCVLVRPIGQVLFFFSTASFVMAAVLVPRFAQGRALLLKKALVALGVATMLLVPRLWWNYQHNHVVGVENQGKFWIHSVAGVVTHHDKNLDYVQAERLWSKQHPQFNNQDAYRAILENFPTWVWLTSKGVLRVLVGHVNTEWCMLFSGQAPIGPGWFKPVDQRQGWQIAGWQLVPWLLGMLLSAAFSVAAYFLLARAVVKRKAYASVYLWWSLVAVALLAGVPQLWGDARFRLGFWPIVLLALATQLKKEKEIF